MARVPRIFLGCIALGSFLAAYNFTLLLLQTSYRQTSTSSMSHIEGSVTARKYLPEASKDYAIDTPPLPVAHATSPAPVSVQHLNAEGVRKTEASAVADAVTWKGNTLTSDPGAVEQRAIKEPPVVADDSPRTSKPLLGEEGEGKFHVIVTANQAKYVAWQTRAMYYHFKKIKEANPDCKMGGYTRVLHSGREDELMDEIPTVIVDPLPKGVDQGYVVLNRPFAFQQFLQQYDIREEYIFMSEPDHLLLKPIPNWATPEKPAAFPFFYINPRDPKLGRVAQKFNKAGGSLDPIGNSPVIMHKDQLAKVVPVWHELALNMKKDREANAAFGWVLEMWAFSVACAQFHIRHELHKEFMLQPPWDSSFQVGGKDAYMIHYTYGNDFDLNGKFTPGKFGQWRFDKRQYMTRAPPKNLQMPPKGTNPVVVKLIEMINDASSHIYNWH